MTEYGFRRLRVPRPQQSWSDRLFVLRRRWRLVVRLSVASASAFALATYVLGHEQAFFAPVAAIVTIIAGAGLRGRTLIELVVGVALGVLVGELLILGIGRGAWQIALVVALTVVVGTLVGLKGMALTQAANSSVLLAAVVPAAGVGDPALTRFLDALVGGVCGLVMVLLLPRNPVRDIDREVQGLLARLAHILRGVARALRDHDVTGAAATLEDARSTQALVDQVMATARNVNEIARLSPMRWRQRENLQRYLGSVVDLDHALRDARVLARRAAAMLRHSEPVPTGMDVAVDALARAVEIFADDLSERDDFGEARQELVEAARIAVMALPGAMTLNSAAVAAQVRSLAADLLLASGATREEIDERLDF